MKSFAGDGLKTSRILAPFGAQVISLCLNLYCLHFFPDGSRIASCCWDYLLFPRDLIGNKLHFLVLFYFI